MFLTVPACSNDIPNGEITGLCSYLPQSNCSYTCDDSYQPASNSSVLLCANGHWHEEFPCVASVVSGKTKSNFYLITDLSRVMRKQTFCICENKDADQLRGDREADQRFCFRYIDSTIPLLSKYEIASL